jgi:type I restriction enzyme M protein
MSQTALQNIEQFESDLWAAADQLRANSKLTSSEYCMPVLGIIFLRHATNRLLEDILRIFDSDTLRTASGDVFGRIYEYFLMKFAMQGAQDNGEFFTPPSLVQTIVNVIEPDHGVVCDLACGSAGIFVQSSHFIEQHGQDASHRVSFFGQEKTATTIRLAKMNLAVHGLEGNIREANTFYEDVHRLKVR